MSNVHHLPVASPRPLRSIRAAASRIVGQRIVRAAAQDWQAEAWDLYDAVGELRFSANALAAAMSRARLHVATVGPDDEEPSPIDVEVDPVPAEVFARFGGGPLDRAELVRRLAVQLFIPGDCYIVGLPPDGGTSPTLVDGLPPEGRTPDGDLDLAALNWYTLSVDEVAHRQGKVELSVGGDDRQVWDLDDVVLIRVWRPHPRRFWEADSPVRANLPVIRELVGLTQHVSATVDSRLAGAGLLLVSDAIAVASGQSALADDGGDGTADDFVGSLIESMLTPIRDRDNASAVVPLVATVPDDTLDKVRHITFSTPFEDGAVQLREEAIRRLALGLDMPPEVLLGMGGTNHWSAWQIEESTVKTHLEPVLALICDALTSDLLWPALDAAGVTDPERYVVWFDTTPLTLRPNRTAEAQALHAAGAITAQALRRESGFDDGDAPQQPDRAVEIALKMAQDQPGPILDNPALLPVLVTAIRQVIDERVAAEQGEPADDDADVVPSGMDLPDTQGDLPADDVP